MNTAVNDEGLRRTAAARAQEDAKARLAEVSANIKRRQQSWSATPWKLWLARGVLALLAVLVISAAFRGVRTGIDRIQGRSDSNLMFPQDTIFDRITSWIPFFGAARSFTSHFMPWSSGRSRRMISPVYSRKMRNGYEELKQNINSLGESFKSGADEAGSKAYNQLKQNFDQLSDLMDQYMPDVDKLTDTDQVQKMAKKSYRRLQDAASYLNDNLASLKDSVSDTGSDAYNAAVEGARRFAEQLTPSSNTGAGLKRAADKAQDAISDSFDASRDNVVQAYHDLSDKIEELSDELEQRAKEMESKSSEELSAADKARYAAIRSFSEAYDELHDAMSQRSTLGKMYEETKNRLKHPFSSAPNAREAFDEASNNFKSLGKRISKTLRGKKAESAFSQAYSAFESQLSSLGSSIKDSAPPTLSQKSKLSLARAYEDLLKSMGKNPTFQDEISDAYDSLLQSLGIRQESRMDRLKHRLRNFF